MSVMRTRARLDRAERLAQVGRVDEAAPSVATASTVVPASANAVWEVLVELQRWPGFLPDVSHVVLDQPGRPLLHGVGFSWRSSGVRLRSVVQRVIPDRELTWTGRAFWLVAVHRNTIEPLDDRSCRLTSCESMTGPMAGLLMPPRKLQAQLQGFVDAIAAAAREHH